MLSSSSAVIEQMITYALSFVYRTVFLYVLSKEYLGISGLITNILQVFSLTELGIGSVISYRLYKPVKDNDVELCHAFINFYKKIYYLIATLVLILSFLFYPYLDWFIFDTSSIPSDINLSVVYWLFVLQSVSSYFFVYTQSLLSSDQKNYQISFANSIFNIISNFLKIIILVFTKSYTLSLAAGIILNIFYSLIFSLYIKREYKPVFSAKNELSAEDKKSIFKDTGSLMCHKIGYVILNSTDSLILSKYIGVSVLGIYSNYSFISTAIDTVLNRMLGSFVSTIGNLGLDDNKEHNFKIYKQLLFANCWLTSFCTICFYCLINHFIVLWLDDTYLLDYLTVTVISLNLFFNSLGIINSVYINGNGLFVKDKIRPLIQAVINIIVSIFLVKKMGIAGVFVGTLVSNVFTTWWRQPIIVFKNVFREGPSYFFSQFCKWMLVSIFIIFAYSFVFRNMPYTILFFLVKLLICVILTNFLFWIVNRKNVLFLDLFNLLITKLVKRTV